MPITNKAQYVRNANNFLGRQLFSWTYRVKKQGRRQLLNNLWLKLLVTSRENAALTIPWKLVGPRVQVGELLWVLGEKGQDTFYNGWERPQLFQEDDTSEWERLSWTAEQRDHVLFMAECQTWDEFLHQYRFHQLPHHNSPLHNKLWLHKKTEPFRATVERLLDIKH